MSVPVLPSIPGTLGKASLYPIYAKLLLVGLFWGGTFIAGRILSLELPPLISALGRFAVAASLLVVVAWKIEGGLPRLNLRQTGLTLLLGLSGIFAYNLFFFGALSYLPAGRTALFVALGPIVTALLLAIFLGERLGLRQWLGIAIAFSGAAIVITRGDVVATFQDIGRSIGLGEVLMTGGVLSWAAYTIIGRYALKGLSPIAATTYATLWGLLLLALAALIQAPTLDVSRFTGEICLSILYLGAIGTVTAFVWYYEGVRAIGPSRASVFNNMVPVFGVLLAALVLSERILASMVIGGLITIAGVMLTNSTRRTARPRR